MEFDRLPIGERAPHVVNCVIEIPCGSSNKYEYDIKMGVFRLDRALFSPLYYPADYGFIPSTKYVDGDPLDVLVLTSHPTFPGCVVQARPVAMMKMRDEKGSDEKIIAVAARDPRYDGIHRQSDLITHLVKEIEHFFDVYKTLEEKDTEVHGWEDVERAYEVIRRSVIS